MERYEDRKAKDTPIVSHPQLVYLKRKLDDLEDVHRDGKRQHAAEVDRLKTEHDHTRKASKEQTEQIARLKKHNELTESKLLDLKKSLLAAREEAREVRVKLRSVESERDRLAVKQSEAAETRKAVASAEKRRNEEVKEREGRIDELKRAVEVEKQRVMEAETRAREQRVKMEREARDVRVRNATLEQKLEKVQAELKEVESKRDALELQASSTSESLVRRVSELETALKATTNAYGRLASTSAPLPAYEKLKLEAARLRLHVARLERKLGNADEQVYELAQLIRQEQATNSFLSEQLRETQEELEWRSNESDFLLESLPISTSSTEDSLGAEINEFLLSEASDTQDIQTLLLTTAHSQLKLCRSHSTQLIEHLSSSEHMLSTERSDATRLKSKLSETEAALTKLSTEITVRTKERDELQVQLASRSSDVFNLQTKLAESEKKLLEAESRARTELARREEMLRKEREVTARMQSTVQKAQMAEDALKAEIDQLSTELAVLDAYREAYTSIAAEMRGLVARNALAEDEALRLSQFNAEILSHRNPTQKILYVDRIRKELAETKQVRFRSFPYIYIESDSDVLIRFVLGSGSLYQKLALSTRDTESALEEVESLRGELAMYKSVTVPFDGKPRTTMTRVRRVGRVPLSTKTLNTLHGSTAVQDVEEEEEEEEDERYNYNTLGEMTMDELS